MDFWYFGQLIQSQYREDVWYFLALSMFSHQTMASHSIENFSSYLRLSDVGLTP